jgi:hypothetical protein
MGGVDACGDVELNCGNASCTLECGSPASSCTGTTVNCGSGLCSATCSGDVTPDVNCDGACECNPC